MSANATPLNDDEAGKLSAYYNWLQRRVEEKNRRRGRNLKGNNRLHRLAYSVINPQSLPQSPNKEIVDEPTTIEMPN